MLQRPTKTKPKPKPKTETRENFLVVSYDAVWHERLVQKGIQESNKIDSRKRQRCELLHRTHTHTRARRTPPLHRTATYFRFARTFDADEKNRASKRNTKNLLHGNYTESKRTRMDLCHIFFFISFHFTSRLILTCVLAASGNEKSE